MPKYTGDKFGFGVAPVEAGGGATEVGYSTSFDNISHAKRTEHKWIVPKTARYNFEVWGADGGMGLAANGDNNNGGIPRYGRGGKVEASFLLDAGTEIGLMIGDNGLPAFSYTSTDNGTYMNNGDGGWGGEKSGESLADGGNSKYAYGSYGGSGSNLSWRGAGGGGGTIVRLFESTTNSDCLIVAGGGGGAGARGRDHGNSHNQGGSGGNANDKVGETRWGRRGFYAGDTSWGWPTGNAQDANSGNASTGGTGGNGYYAGGAGGGGGCGGGGGGATCTYCGASGGGGGSCGSAGNWGSGGYNNANGGFATSQSGTQINVGQGGSNNTSGKGAGGGGGGGYRGGGSGHWGNGQGHAGAGGGGGGSSYCMAGGNSYDVKGLNGITSSSRFTSEQKPMRLGNPGGGRVFIWEANKDPLGKDRPAEMTADKIQYLCRSQNGGESNSQRQYYLGSSPSQSDPNDGGGPDYSCYNNYPYQTPANTCDAVVIEISGSGLWELHSVTVGQGQGYDYPLPYRHQCWIHVIEGTETGGVGIHTEKFDSNNTTGNPGVAGWYAHMRACSKNQNTDDGYIELFFEKPAVMKRGEKYTIALDWSCGGTNSTNNNGGIACMNNGAVSSRALRGTGKGTATWTGVTAYNGPHGLGTKNQDNGMETSASQGQMVHFGVRSIEISSGGGGGGGGASGINTTDLIHYWNPTPSTTGANFVVDSVASNTLTSQWGSFTFNSGTRGGEIIVPANTGSGWFSFQSDITFGSGYSNSDFTFFWCGEKSQAPWWMLATGSDGNNFIGYSGGTLRIDSNQDYKGDLSYSSLSVNNLYCIYMTMASDGSMVWYVNGSQVGSNSYNGSWSSHNVIFDSLNHYDSGGSYQTEGKFYFAGFYSRVLSSSEVSSNWSAHQTRLGI